MNSSRRAFIRSSTFAISAASYRRILGANELIRLGSIGTGLRGSYLMKELKATNLVSWGAVCDIYSVRRDEALTFAGSGVKAFADHRRVLDMKDIDAVVIATPDHWHAQIAVEACDAGKDVYVEKPMVHYPKDGQAVVRAVRRNQRVLQVGTQGRAVPHFQEARRKVMDTGLLGKVGLVRTWYDGNWGYIQTAPPGMENKPDGLDWDRWLGPGPKVPWNPDIYFSPYKWLHYDGGMILGIGIHVIDCAHQFLALTNPLAAVAGGGNYIYKGDRDTPDVANLILEYPGLNLTFEAEIATADKNDAGAAGIELRGKCGVLTVHRNPNTGWEYKPTTGSGHAAAKGPGGPSVATQLVRNWLQCIRTRQKPVANEEVAYWSTMACFLGNQAFRTKSRVTWDNAWNLPA